MRKVIGRIVTRMQGERDGLMLGVTLSDSNINFFEPSTVYDIQYCDLSGDVILKKVGKSAVSEGRAYDSPIGLCWGQRIDNILERGKGHVFLTEEEVNNLLAE